ncbi:hypothetical protein C8R44DRAFT_859701 [Mycena epipterygia]|nr:hypothetical protein C8R44DRAFT_859701 [Mycena epipterygia]
MPQESVLTLCARRNDVTLEGHFYWFALAAVAFLQATSREPRAHEEATGKDVQFCFAAAAKSRSTGAGLDRTPPLGARMWAYHHWSIPLGFRKHYFQFGLTYQPEGSGYLSTTFKPRSSKEPTPKRKPTWTGSTGSFYVPLALPKIRQPGTPWFSFVQWCAARGLVFRVVGEGKDSFWTPGLMEKQGRRWVWKMRTVPDLIQEGLDLSEPILALMGEPIVIEPIPTSLRGGTQYTFPKK